MLIFVRILSSNPLLNLAEWAEFKIFEMQIILFSKGHNQVRPEKRYRGGKSTELIYSIRAFLLDILGTHDCFLQELKSLRMFCTPFIPSFACLLNKLLRAHYVSIIMLIIKYI